MRTRIMLLAVTAIVGAGLVGPVGNASAATAQQNFKKTFFMNGKASGGKRVTGKYTIDRFVKSKYTGRLVAIGTFRGKIGNKKVVRRNLRSAAAVRRPAGASAAATCTILDLTINPIDIHLLGLNVHLDTVHLLNTGTTGSGNLLGNLDPPTGGLTPLQQAQILNALLGAVLGAIG